MKTSKITQTVILEEKRSEEYSGPSQRLEWIIFKKLKTTFNQSFVRTSMLDVWEDP